jgi:hypothetical protein
VHPDSLLQARSTTNKSYDDGSQGYSRACNSIGLQAHKHALIGLWSTVTPSNPKFNLNHGSPNPKLSHTNAIHEKDAERPKMRTSFSVRGEHCKVPRPLKSKVINSGMSIRTKMLTS